MKIGDVIKTKDNQEFIFKELEQTENIHGYYNLITEEGYILFRDDEGFEIVGQVISNGDN